MPEISQTSSFINDDTIVALVKQKKSYSPVSFAGIDCNWNQTSSGSVDNYFHLWATVNYFNELDKVFLQGAKYGNWNIEYQMKLATSVNNIGIYSLSLENPDEFPDEFIIRLNKEDHNILYDNNNYRNFHLEQNRGHFISAVQSGDVIFSFNNIIPIQVLCLNH